MDVPVQVMRAITLHIYSVFMVCDELPHAIRGVGGNALSSQQPYKESVLTSPLIPKRELKHRVYSLLKVTKVRRGEAAI